MDVEGCVDGGGAHEVGRGMEGEGRREIGSVSLDEEEDSALHNFLSTDTPPDHHH